MYPVANEGAMQAELAAGRADIAACSADRQPRLAPRRRRRRALQPDPAAGGLSAQRRAPARHPAARVGKARGARRQSAGAHPAAPQEHRGTGPAVGGDRAQLRRPGRRRRRRRGAVRHHRRARVFLRAPPLSRTCWWASSCRSGARCSGSCARARPDCSRASTHSSTNSPPAAACRSWCRNPPATPAVSSTRNRASSRATSATGCRMYRSWFEQAALQTGIDWRLLAAIGYQESKWDPRAESEDGAIGVMMLTSDTAQAMGIKDRNDPEQSIFAGARYLAAGAREDSRPHPGARPHLAHHRRLQRRLRPSRGRAHHRAGAAARTPIRGPTCACACRCSAQQRWCGSGQARLRARLGAGAVRRSHAALPDAARMAAGRGQRACRARHRSPGCQCRACRGCARRSAGAGCRTSRRPRSRAHTRRRGPDPQPRRAAKNSSSSRAHSSMSTPPNTSTR